MIRVSIATRPHRAPYFNEVLRSMLDQTLPPDEIQVTLNDYPEEDARKVEEMDPRIRAVACPNMGAAAKFRGIEDWPGWTLTMDDDIHYPPDYIERMTRAQQCLGGIVAVHGSICRTTYMGPGTTRYNYWDALSSATRVSVVGTGTACLHRDQLGGLTYDHFRSRVRLDDPFIAVHAHCQGLPLWVIDRPEGWLREQQGSQQSGKELWRQISGFDLRKSYRITWQQINRAAGIR